MFVSKHDAIRRASRLGFIYLKGYKPSIFYPKRTDKPLYNSLVNQCEKLNMPFLIKFPIEANIIDSTYTLIVDALFGFSFKGPVKAPFIDVLELLKVVKIPICSVDIPSGSENLDLFKQKIKQEKSI
jgi:NAD(P)H-hydrate epimerase